MRGPADLSRRCQRCYFPPEACLCPEVRPVTTRTRLVLLRHASERNRPSNSGRWAALALPGLTVLDYALPGPAPDLSLLEEPGSAVLFPSPRGGPPEADPPRQVVVLDATWAQARRMIQRVPALRTMPRISVPEPSAPRPRPQREATVAGGLSTLEAMAGILHRLGEVEAGRALDALHAAAMQRGWRLRRGSEGPWERAAQTAS